MKNQFIKMKPGLDKNPPVPAQWPDGVQQDIHAPQLQELTPSPPATQMGAGNGLVPSWPATNMPGASKVFNGPILSKQKQTRDLNPSPPITEQETAMLQAPQVPNRGAYIAPPVQPQWSQSGITPLMDPAGPVSPHQSQIGMRLFPQPTAGKQTGPVPAVGMPPYAPAYVPSSGAAWPQNMPPAYRGGPPFQQPALAAQPPMAPPPKKLRQKRRFPIWARVLVAALVFLVVAGGSAYAYYQANYGTAIGNITGAQALHIKNSTGTKVDGTTNQAAASANTSTLTGGRINILLLGSDTDGKNGNDIATGTPLAQTDIIITIDPQTKYVGMLSIPRDLQVSIPGNAAGKMDFAFEYGVAQGGGTTVKQRVGYGAGLAEDTILANYGIKINYYAWVDIYGFAKVVNTIGGVDIDAIHPVVDNSYPDDANKATANDYKRLYIAPGPQHMDGLQALEYVRTRHADLVADFGRSARQQQLLSALKQKLVNSNIIAEAPQLLTALDGSLFTDLTLDQMIQIANYAHGVDTNNVEKVTLGPPNYATSSNSSTNFFPNCAAITSKIATMFGLGDQANCISQVASNASQSSTTVAATTQPATNVASSTTTQQGQQGITTNLSGSVTSLVDLMLLGVFQSFDALKN